MICYGVRARAWSEAFRNSILVRERSYALQPTTKDIWLAWCQQIFAMGKSFEIISRIYTDIGVSGEDKQYWFPMITTNISHLIIQ